MGANKSYQNLDFWVNYSFHNKLNNNLNNHLNKQSNQGLGRG